MSNIVKVTDATFDREVLEQKGTVLVDFAATWCGPCKAIEPILESLARERAGSLKVVKVDMDESPLAVKRLSVRAAPTLFVFRDGEQQASVVGAVPKERLVKMILGAQAPDQATDG
jgi:thioredoxin 1